MADTPVTDINKLSKSTQATIAANAKSQGVTPQEYLASRGGLFGSGYYGDTPEFRRLDDATYATAAKTGGAGAINAALTAKKRAAYIADPSLIEDPRLRLAFQNKAITIDELLNAEIPGSGGVTTRSEPIGAMADGTPIYGYGSDGKPVTSPTGTIYSKTSASDAVTKFSSGAAPLSTGSSATGLGATGTATDAQRSERQSAYDLLYLEFQKYGLQSLVEPLKGLIISGASPAEFTIKLRDSDAYKLRFAANAKRIANGFAAVDEATYLALEDKFQSIMQNYGVPESYYKKGAMGVQEGFEKLIANNVDAVTLEERIMEGVKVNQGSKLLIDTAKQFYPSLTDGDFLAYALDPKNALSEIRRKVTASEIGSAQIGAGLAATVGGAEELAKAGVTGKQYQQAAPTIADAALRGGQLASIYKQDPYTQQTAEALLLDVPGSAEALKKTKKLTSLETAAFGGSAGAGAIARDRAGVL